MKLLSREPSTSIRGTSPAVAAWGWRRVTREVSSDPMLSSGILWICSGCSCCCWCKSLIWWSAALHANGFSGSVVPSVLLSCRSAAWSTPICMYCKSRLLINLSAALEICKVWCLWAAWGFCCKESALICMCSCCTWPLQLLEAQW